MSKKTMKAFSDSDVVIKEQPTPEVPGEEVVPETFTATPTTSASPTGEEFIFASVDIPKRTGRGSKLSYPINVLVAGSKDSFLVPASPDKFKNVTASIRTYAYRNGFKVTLRNENTDGSTQGVRVWRKV
jgi:hypothetical protein